MQFHRSLSLAAAVVVSSSSAFGQPSYDDGHGREWRQLTETTNLSWNQVAQVCPADGVTPGQGSVGGRDFSGWVWATRDQVRTMLGRIEPRLVGNLSVQGPEYLFTALNFLSGDFIDPTFDYYTSFGGYLYTAGWVADRNPDGTGAIAEISAEYPVFYGLWSVGGGNTASAPLPFAGVWLWRSTNPACPADFNSDGFVDFFDYDAFVGCFETVACPPGKTADFNGDGFVDFFDYDLYVAAFEGGC